MSDTTRTLSFLFTDIVGSTALWEAHDEEMFVASREHFALLDRCIATHDGTVVKSAGDGVFAVFPLAIDAVGAAIEAQLQLVQQVWSFGPLSVRMGVHTGECYRHDDDYLGRSINRASRLEHAAYGGQILVSATTAALVDGDLDEGFELIDLGDHHFDGIAIRQRVFTVSGPGLAGGFPPLPTEVLRAPGPPPEHSPLFGRDDDVTGIEAEFDDHRLITLVGVPGVGKSRLAQRLALEAWRDDPEEVSFVDLARCDRPDAVLGAVTSALGVRPAGGESSVACIVRALSHAEHLVVLDNCEPVLEPIRGLVDEILARCPGVSVLATSRMALGLAAELVWPVGMLSTPSDRDDGVEAIRKSDAAAMLLERATARQRGFDPGSDDLRALAELCRLVDGLPLAIDLAAAQLTHATPAELLRSLQSTPERIDADGTLRASLDASYARLTAAQQLLFDRIAVFARRATREAIDAVCGEPGDDLRADLHALTTASLVVAEHEAGRTRFSQPYAVREYARTHGAVDASLRARHARWFVDRAEENGRAFRTGEMGAAVRRMTDDLDDCRLAFHRLRETGEWEDARRLVVALHDYCQSMLEPEIYRWADTLLDEAEAVDLTAVRSIAAIGAWIQGDQARAIALGDEAVGAGGEHPDTINAHMALLNSRSFAGDIEGAAEALRALIRICRASGDPYWLCFAYGTEAHAMALVGDRELALRRAGQALEVADRIDNANCRFHALYGMGLAAGPEDPATRRSAFEAGLAAARSVGSRWQEGLLLVELLALHVDDGDVRAAAATALSVLRHLEDAGTWAQLWELCLEVAGLLAAAERPEPAALLLAAATDRPRRPRTDIGDRDARLRDRLTAALGADRMAQLAAQARFEQPQVAVARCRSELLTLAG